MFVFVPYITSVSNSYCKRMLIDEYSHHFLKSYYGERFNKFRLCVKKVCFTQQPGPFLSALKIVIFTHDLNNMALSALEV